MDPTFCIGDLYCGVTVAHILLWVLTFAITYGILEVLGIFGKGKKRVNAMVALALASFVLLSAPVAVISVISNMSNSMVTLAVGVIVLMALVSIAGVGEAWKNYAKYVAAVLVLIAVAVFMGAGGLTLIGVGSIPSLGIGPEIWVIALVVIAVVYLTGGKEATTTPSS